MHPLILHRDSHRVVPVRLRFPASQIQSENDASDKAYVKNDISECMGLRVFHARATVELFAACVSQVQLLCQTLQA